jgi:hypothetical protein
VDKAELDALLFEAFVAGFCSSGEGYNGEYPFSDKGINAERDDGVREMFSLWLEGSRMDGSKPSLRS